MGTKIVTRGLILPGGMDELDDEIGAKYTSWLLLPFVVYGLLRDHAAGRLDEPVDLVGHSLGANVTRKAANKLGDAGVEVGLVVMLDPTYEGDLKHGRGYAFQSSDFRACEINGAENISRPDLTHMGLTTDPEVIAFIKENLSR